MTNRKPPASTRLVEAAYGLFGPNWQTPLAAMIDVPQRKLSRMFVASDEGRDYPGADEALQAFAAALTERAKDVRKLAR